MYTLELSQPQHNTTLLSLPTLVVNMHITNYKLQQQELYVPFPQEGVSFSERPALMFKPINIDSRHGLR